MPDNQDITLRILVHDAQGQFRGGTVDVEFKHRTLSDYGKQRGLDASREINIAGLRRAPTGDYKITVTPTDVFKPQSQFINIPASGFLTIEVIIKDERITGPGPEPAAKLNRVEGQVSRPDGTFLADTLVQAFDLNLGEEQFLGKAITDANGNFKLNYLSKPFEARGGADLIVRVFDAHGGVLAASAVIHKAKPLEQVSLVLSDKPSVEKKEFVVRGTVRDAKGKPAAGATVRAFDRDLRSEELLGAATADAKGTYEIRYSPEQFLRAEKQTADLRVAAYDPEGRELVSSPIIFNAKPEEIVDLSIGGEYRGPSEFEDLLAQLTPLLQDVPLVELTEDDLTFLTNETGQDSQRITFLVLAHQISRKTGLAPEAFYAFFREGLPTSLPALLAQSPDVLRRALVVAVNANIIPGHFSSKVDEIFEGLKRAIVQQAFEQPADRDRSSFGALLATTRLSVRQQESFLNTYVNHTGPIEEFWRDLQNSPELKDHVEDMQFTLQLGALTSNHLPLVHELKRRQTAGEIAALSDLTRFDEKDWQAIITGRNGENSIGVPPDVPGADEPERVRNYARAMSNMMEDAFPTAFITQRLEKDHLPGSNDLFSFLSNNPSFDLKTTRVDSYLKNNPDAFTSIADKEGTKSQIKAMQRVYKLAPRYAQTSVLMKHGHDSAYTVSRTGLNAFMATYADAFGAAQARDIHEKAQQTHAVALNLLVSFGPMIGRVGTHAVPEQQVISNGANAEQVGTSGSVLTQAMSAETSLEIGDSPDWSTLFGSLDLCDCGECQSVHSPAAYLVDALHFLKDRRSKIRDVSAKEILFLRRPDLGEIELTCENTNTPLPYVDLVNEVLEDAVAPPPRFDQFTLSAGTKEDLDGSSLTEDLKRDFSTNNLQLTDAATINVKRKGEWWTIDDLAVTYTVHIQTDRSLLVTTRSRQTSGAAREREANPQYVNKDAYDKLRDQVFPWTLPFDLWSEETRTCLAHLGVQRHQILEAFLPAERPAILSNLAVACEYLGVTSGEAKIITGGTMSQPGARSPGLWNLWGFEAADAAIPDPADSTALIAGDNWVDLLGERVDVFLQQSGLGYREMLDLLDTSFINPVAASGRTIQIVSTDPENPDTCETRVLSLEGFDEAAAERVVCFVRLWRKLGWSMHELDRAITVFPPTLSKLSEEFLVKLSHVERLHRESGLPVMLLLSWWGKIDAAVYTDHSNSAQARVPSLYAQLFRNRGVTNPLDPDFPDDATRLDTETHPEKKLSNHVPTITAGLGISAANLALLCNDGNVIPQVPDPADPEPNDSLTLDNLSKLLRHTTLARSLKISIPDYLTMVRLNGADPFAGTADTLLFVEKVGKTLDAGFSLAELNYLLRHEFTRTSGLAPDDNSVAAILNEIRSGLHKIAVENTFSKDTSVPGGATTDQTGELTRQKLALLNWSSPLIEMVVNTLNDGVTYEASLDHLPVDLALPTAASAYEVDLATLPRPSPIPDEMRDLVTYDADNLKLKASRLLIQPEGELLLSSVRSNANLLHAVNTLLLHQEELQRTIKYDADARKLRFTGVMTQERRTQLEGLSADLPYRVAIDVLFNAPRQFIRRSMRTFSVNNFARDLAALPATANPFPKALAGRVYFDTTATPHKLHFVGPMLEQEREMLSALASTDTDYQAAVNALFAPPDTPPDASDVFLTFLEANDDAARLFDDPTTAEARFDLLLKTLLPYLRRTLSERLVVQKIAAALGLEAKAAESLLTRWVTSPADRSRPRRVVADFLESSFVESNPNVQLLPGSFPVQFMAYTLLHKIAAITTRFKLTVRQLTWLFEYGPGPGWLDLNSLPTRAGDPTPSFGRWLRLQDLFQLRDALPGGEDALNEIFNLARTGDVSQADLLQRISEHTRWSLSDLKFLAGRDGFALTHVNFSDERALARLRNCFDLLNRLGMPAKQCRELAQGEVTAEQARGVLQAVRAKYDEAEWLGVAKPLRDRLREKQRTALVAYLAAHPNRAGGQHWKDSNDLYAHFLIDVEMSPCMMTSRIKQAIGSTQLFVQRCLMNLEPQVAANAAADPKWLEWKWMKNYRVWEANRKVFLYPENWIEPELRDDKSPFFKDLEGELLQSDLTLESVETAFRNYLEKLDRVARLDIVGLYHQVEEAPGGNVAVDILHVFGRTQEPYAYHYRQRVDKASWTAWERVDLDIQGDHLIPVVWKRRLYLFWPTFTEKARPYNLNAPTALGAAVPGPDTYWEVNLPWSERRQGKWTTKKVSSVPFFPITKTEGQRTITDPTMFFFKSFLDEENKLNFQIHQQLPSGEYMDEWMVSHAMKFGGCHADPVFESVSAGVRMTFDRPVTGTIFSRMFLEKTGDSRLYLPAPTDKAALSKTPGTFRLLPHHDGASLTRHPFFYQDDTRAFFVAPAEVQSDTALKNGFQIDIGSLSSFGTPYYAGSKSLATNAFGSKLYSAELLFEPSYPTSPAIGAANLFTSDAAASRSVTETSVKDASSRFEVRTAPQTLTQLGGSVGAARLIGSKGNLPPDTGANFFSTYTVSTRYTFQTFYHPFVSAFVHELNRDGLDGMLQRKVQTEPALFLPRPPSGRPPPPFNFQTVYEPQPVVDLLYPKEEVDFEYDGAYSLYNWELFFHAPLMIADRLSKSQRFEEAQKWFHYIFDPTDTSDDLVPQRYWHTKKFYETTRKDYDAQRIQEILRLMAAAMDPVLLAAMSHPARQELKNYQNAVRDWRRHPFKPHLIARLRTAAYQKTVVMKYIDNLIAWGDQLFRRDTIESINEATQLYILAADILGRRPESIPPRAIPRVQTFNSLETKLDSFSEALVQIEEFVSPSGVSRVVNPGGHTPVTLPAMLYFCVPKNDKLLGYWDTVADRLFKIRHCRNIAGVERQLPLFEPPIDPGMLVRAAAAGVDLSSVLNDTNVALPYYRFNVLAQKAGELCADLKSLGSALLSALEKRDAEELTLIRAGHEKAMLERVEQVKQRQYDEAVQNQTALQKSRALAEARYAHYQKLLGITSPGVPPAGQSIDDEKGSPLAATLVTDGTKIIASEQAEMVALSDAHDYQRSAEELERHAQIAHLFPNSHIQPWGLGLTYGGQFIGTALSAFASHFRSYAGELTYQANRSAKLGQFVLREHDWALQNNLAAREIMQIDQQILAANIRIEIADKELKNHRLQVDNAREVEAYMRDKYTNEELYAWMAGQVSDVYFQTYQLAFDVAKRAERAYRYELGLTDSNFVQFGYWDSLKKGLMSGEKLFHDLKRMEVGYLDQNKREYEITKHISFAQLDPLALLRLKQTGECFVSIPEAMFDIDFPGHYMRRIKAVNLTIPCVTGPYTGINCTFTLLKSSVRHSSALPAGNYGRPANEQDSRFTESFGAIQSIVTSSGQNDSGLFEQNLHDERYLPFEGNGAISEWRVELPKEFRQFDYNTISDVILHMRYSARDGGATLKQQASTELRQALEAMELEDDRRGHSRLFSARHEFASEWHRFMNPAVESSGQKLVLHLTSDRFPFVTQARPIQISRVEIFLLMREKELYEGTDSPYARGVPLRMLISPPETPDSTDRIAAGLSRNETFGGVPHRSVALAGQGLPFDLSIETSTSDLALIASELRQTVTVDGIVYTHLNTNAIKDILVLCHYSLG
jgi:hypothetical protein